MAFPKSRDELEQGLELRKTALDRTGELTDDENAEMRGLTMWEVGEYLLRLQALDGTAGPDRREEAVAYFDEAATVLWPFESQRHTAVYARWRQVHTLALLGRSDEALPIVSAVVSEISLDWTSSEHPDLMPLLLGTWVGLLDYCGFHEDADAAADAAIERFDGEGSATQRILLGVAFLAKAAAARARGEVSEALAFLDDVIARCSAPIDQYRDEQLSQVAQALVMRGQVFEAEGRGPEALAAYEEALVQCGSSRSNVGRDFIAEARAGRKRLGQTRRSGNA